MPVLDRDAADAGGGGDIFIISFLVIFLRSGGSGYVMIMNALKVYLSIWLWGKRTGMPSEEEESFMMRKNYQEF